MQLATSDMQSAMGAPAGGIDRPSSAPPPLEQSAIASDSRLSAIRPSPLAYVPSSLSAANSAVTSPSFVSATRPSASSRAKGMQLGANKVPTGVASAALASKLADEVAASEGINDGNPWGTDDLIDINADQDDWSQPPFLFVVP